MENINLDYFARRLECWVAPDTLIASAGRLYRNRQQAEDYASLILVSDVLTTVNNGGLSQLVDAYLKRFRIPSDVLSLVRKTETGIPQDIWDEIGALQFTGTVAKPTSGVLDFNPHAVLVLSERDVVIDMLTQPLQALVGMVSAVAQTWLPLRDSGLGSSQVFLQHRSADPLGAWLDAFVAGECGFPNIATPRNAAAVTVGYREVTISGWGTHEPGSVESARESARFQAEETRKPIERDAHPWNSLPR